jgi:hypothetical protein
MSSTLCRTALLCCARRLRAAVLANPLIGAVGIVAAITSPLLAVVAGRSFGGVVVAARADDALAFALALAFGIAAMTGGTALAALAPTRELLGAQLGPAPVPERDVFVGLLLLPASLALLPAMLVAFAFGTSADGPRFAAIVLVSGLAGALYGAAAAETAVGVMRRSRVALASGAALVCTWLLVGYSADEISLGPIAPFSAALRGELGLSAAQVFVGAVALALWGLTAIGRPPPPQRRAAVRLTASIPPRPTHASASAMAVRVLRNAHVQRHVATAVAFAVGGAAAMRIALGAGDLAAFFAGSVALVAASVLPLVGAALRRDARWLARPAPVSRRFLAAADAFGAVFAGALVVAVVLAFALPLGRFDAGAYLLLATTAATVLGAAAATAAVLPWHPTNVIEQLASYVLLTVVAAVLAAALGRAAGTAAAFGLSDAASATFVSVLVLAGGIGVAAALEE